MMGSQTLRLAAARLLPWGLLAVSMTLVFGQIKHPLAVLDLWRQWGEIGVLALGMTAILLTGGVDLSVGSIVALAGMALGLSWSQWGLPIAWAVVVAIVCGTLAGALNGALVLMGIAPLVATLATMAFYAGLAMALARGQRIAGLPESLTWLGQRGWGPVPWQVVLLLAASVPMAVFVHFTRFGRYLYALGDNRQAALFAAVPVRRLEWSLYTLNGFLAGLVAVVYTARGGAAVPDPSPGMELQVIACAILGGTRVTGGFGGIGRTLLGLAVLAHLQIGLRLLGSVEIPIPWSQQPWTIGTDARLILIGVLVIAVAIANERLQRREG